MFTLAICTILNGYTYTSCFLKSYWYKLTILLAFLFRVSLNIPCARMSSAVRRAIPGIVATQILKKTSKSEVSFYQVNTF